MGTIDLIAARGEEINRGGRPARRNERFEDALAALDTILDHVQEARNALLRAAREDGYPFLQKEDEV